jgi:hypothetical protein
MADLLGAVPELIGICPGEHLGHFYVPLAAGDSPICPECEDRMVIFLRVHDSGIDLTTLSAFETAEREAR